jgi:hypothetical protein
MGAAAATGAAVALGTKLGLEAGSALTKKATILEMVKGSRHSDVNPDRVPSPDMTLIHSITEIGDLQSTLE